jgi:hypothetical protein
MLSSVLKEQKIIRRELEELETVEFDLSRKLQEALLEPDNDPFAMAPGFDDLLSLSSSQDTPPQDSRQTTGPLDGSSPSPLLETNKSGDSPFLKIDRLNLPNSDKWTARVASSKASFPTTTLRQYRRYTMSDDRVLPPPPSTMVLTGALASVDTWD